MIAKDPGDSKTRTTTFTHEGMSEIMERAVKRALAESRKMGVPIPIETVDGKDRYELPDGMIVDEDPWHGKPTAPEGWFERFDIPPEDRPPVRKPAQ